jgi:hypothetical protein
MTDRPIQEHPAYYEGFFDAMDLEPLFDDAVPEYAAGWRAYWKVREILNDEDFLDRPEVQKLPASKDYPLGGSKS